MDITFDHVSLSAKDPEKMKDFLIKLLNVTSGERPTMSFPGYFLYAGDLAVIHLFKQADDDTSIEQKAAPNIVHHICFFSNNYQEVITNISNLNAPYTMKTRPETGNKQIFVQGPENLLIEIQAKPN